MRTIGDHLLRLALLGAGVASCSGELPALGGGAQSSSTTSGSDTDTGADSTGSLPQSPICIDYVACVAITAPDFLPQTEALYGEGGSCWATPEMAQTCETQCEQQIEALCPNDTAGGTGEEPLACSMDALRPTAPSPVDAGTEPEQLPIDVAVALENNCGCHYIDPQTLEPDVPAYFGGLTMATWQDFHTPFMGTLTWQRVQQRTIVELSMPPQYFCGDLDQGSLTNEDYVLLADWLEAGAPDAVRWRM
ncbi:MAG: hypothetical protein AAF799_42255 [Myxococcota bacterium]